MSRIPDFTKIPLRTGGAAPSLSGWGQQAEASTGRKLADLTWTTNEQIPVQPLYTAADIEGAEHLGFLAGIPPFLRGPYASMYVIRPWTVRQYAGFSTAEESNAFYRQRLDYRQYAGKNIGISPQIPFEISAVAETARLVVHTEDRYGRIITLTSVDLVLLTIGENETNPGASLPQPYLIRALKSGDVITGGVLRLTALARPVNPSPVIFELIDETGKVIAVNSRVVDSPSGDLSHTPFTIDIPYQVSDITPVRLSIRQESANRIPGTVALISLPLILAP